MLHRLPIARRGLLAAAAWAACAWGLRAQVDLFPDRVYPTASEGRPIVALRLDGDALPDVVAGEHTGVTRLLSAGGGVLAPLPLIPEGFVEKLLVADMRADGLDDVVGIAKSGGHMVKVLVSDGTGGLSVAGAQSAGGLPHGLAAGDFDGDGDLDVVTTNELDDVVRVLFGDGLGGLSTAVTFPVGNVDPQSDAEPLDVAAGDVDEDGDPDLVSANAYWPSSLSILLGDGAGLFALPMNLQAGPVAFWNLDRVELADMDNDGHLDILSSSLLLGDGMGGFDTPLPGLGGDYAVDFDGDGNLDVVLALGKLDITLGDGQGGTLSFTQFDCGSNGVDVAVADLDADGDLDAAVRNLDLGAWSDIRVMLNDGASSFPPPSYDTWPTSGSVSLRMAIADLDDDGVRDLVALNSYSSDLSVMRGDGAAGYLPPVLVPVGTVHAKDLGVADVDGDGDEDVAVLLDGQFSTESAAVLLGDGAGGFSALPLLALGTFSEALALGDVNEDGLDDLVTANTSPDVLTVRLATGGGAFGPPTTLPPLWFPCCFGGAEQLRLVDLDADGHLDALIARSAGGFAVCLGDGAGSFGPNTPYTGLGEFLVPADLDADGDVDIVGRDYNGFVGVMFAVAGGYAPVVAFQPFGGRPSIGDLDADGDPDIVVLDAGTSDATCLLNDGAGNFTVHGTFLAGGRPLEGFVDDLDGNGYGDIVALCEFTGGGPSGLVFPEHVTVLHGQTPSPWLDVGHALAGSAGAPSLAGFGTLQPGTPLTLKIAQALPLGSATLVFGASEIDAPFKGGVLVPDPTVLIFGLPLGASGAFAGSGTWYSGLPAGTSVFFQAWIADPAGPVGYAATNGLLGTTP